MIIGKVDRNGNDEAIYNIRLLGGFCVDLPKIFVVKSSLETGVSTGSGLLDRCIIFLLHNSHLNVSGLKTAQGAP